MATFLGTIDSDSRLARQEFWRKQLVEAESAFNAAAADLRRLLDPDPTERPSPDVQEQLAAATARKDPARHEYRRILRIFSDLVVHGKNPAATG